MNLHRMFNRYMSEVTEGESGGHSAAPAADPVEVDTEGATDEASAAAAAVEAEASKMGWTPKEQFKGDPAKWRPADEFVERGKNMLPIVQATVKRQEREIAELRQTTKEFADHLSKTEARAYDRALASLKEQRKEALANGDGDAFEQADERIEELRREVEAKEAKARTAPAPADDPVYAEWETRNKSWLSDPKAAAFGDMAAHYLRQTGETATGADFLELVAKEVKSKFPEKFENPRRENAASVEGAAPAARKGGKGYADMPADARAACDRMAKNGFSDPKQAAAFKADYTKQYFEGA
jgi:hypothetical protein